MINNEFFFEKKNDDNKPNTNTCFFQHFKSGIIRVKCTSTVIRMHTMSNEIILRTEIPMTSDKYLDNYFSENLNQLRK